MIRGVRQIVMRALRFLRWVGAAASFLLWACFGRAAQPSSAPAAARSTGPDASVSAQSFISRGEFGNAIDLLQRNAALHADQPGTWERLAELHDWLGDLPAAQSDLQKAIQLSGDAGAACNMLERRAIIDLDAGDASAAIADLDKCVGMDKAMTLPAGLVCALYGRYQDCARYLSLADSDDARWLITAGNAALRGGDAPAAIALFDRAIAKADTTPLQHYAVERLVAAHRQNNSLGKLADRWLGQPSLPRDCWMPLAIVLRETGRIDDLLSFWSRISADTGGTTDPLVVSLASEVIDAARYAGKTREARAICLRVLANHPDGNSWLRFTAGALCDWDDAKSAEELLEGQIAECSDAAQLRELAQIARDLGLGDAAMSAGAKLSALSQETRVAGLLLRADVASRFADYPKRDEYLTQAAAAARSHPADADAVAGALEFANRIDDAIALLQATASSGGYDQNLRLAALLAKEGRFAASADTYERLRSVAPTDALRAQASIELLDNAAAAHALPRVIADLQSKLKRGDGTADDVSLLANAMVRARQPNDADSLLRSTPLLDEKSRMNQLAILLLRLHRNAEAEAVLRRLVAIDPAGAVDHLEEIASTAIAGKDLATANSAIAEILRRVGDVPASAQLMGNIFDRLGRPADAAACYERALAADPRNGDTWLLWSAAMSKAGMTLVARQRLQVLAHDADDDAIFVTAVDGVLNQKPPAFVTQSLRREAITRLARNPQSVLLWHVVTDLADELNQNAFSRRSIEGALPFDDEERDQRLRELLGETDNHPEQSDAAIEVGHCMELLGDRFPPQDFINLGDQLLNAHRPADALPALRRAVQETSADRVRLRVVDLLAKFNQFSDALAIALPLAARHGFDPDFQLDFAQINEAAGNTESALHAYERALGVYLDQLVADGATDSGDGQPDNLAESALGAVGCARSPADADALVAMVLNRNPAPATTRPSPGTNLPRILAILRQIAFALHQPTAVENAEDSSLGAATSNLAVRSRLQWGLFDAAESFAAAHHADAALPPGTKWASQYCADVTHDQNSFPGDSAYLALKIRGALAIGDVQQALGVARALSLQLSGIDSTLLNVFAQAAIVGKDNRLADRIALETVLRALKQPQSAAGESMMSGAPAVMRVPRASLELANLVSNQWSYLDDEGRLDLQSLLEKSLSDATDPAKRAAEARLLLTVASTTGQRLENGASLALTLVDPRNPDAPSITHICLLLPSADRPLFLTTIASVVAAQTRLVVYLDLLEQAWTPLDDATVDVIAKGISQMPRQAHLPWNAWCSNPAQASQLSKVADALAAIIPAPDSSVQSIGPTVACALAYRESGAAPDADRLARIAIEQLKTWQLDQTMLNRDYFAVEMLKPGDAPPRPYLLQAALSAMSPAARAGLESQLFDSPAGPDDQVKSTQPAAQLAWDLTFRALVKQSIGDQRGAIALLAKSFALYPFDPSVRKLYSEWLFHEGYDQQLLASFTDVFTGAQGDRRILGFVMQSARHLFRTGNDYHRSDVADDLDLPDLVFPAAAADSAALGQAFNRLLQIDRTRASSQFSSPLLDDPPLGGLAAVPTQHPVELLASSPAAMQTILANWFARPVCRAPWIEHLLSMGIAAGAVDRQSLLDLLASRGRAKVLDDADRDLLAILADAPNTPVPPVLRDDAWRAAAIEPADNRFDLLGKLALHAAAFQSTTGPANAASNGPRRDSEMLPPTTPWHVPHIPVLTGSVPEHLTAAELQSRIDANDSAAASDELQTMVRADCFSTQFVQIQIVAARVAAELDDLPTMQLRVRAAIEAWKSRPPPSVVNTEDDPFPALADVTPAAFASPRIAAAFSRAMQSEIERARVRWPADSELVAALAKIGGRLQQGGYNDQAQSFLDVALHDNAGLCDGNQTICVADLAQRLGDAALAQKLQSQCLHSGCLPVGRIKPLLSSVDRSQRAELLQFVPADLPAALVQVP